MIVRDIIEIVTRVRDEATGRLKNFQKVTKGVDTTTGAFVETTKKINKETGRMIIQQRKITRGLKPFQFEWLSVLFLGMAINRMFGRYVKGALDMTGVTDILTETFKYFIFTALEPFMGVIYGIIDTLWELPEPVQKAIGWFFIFMTVLGGIAMYLAMLKLGFSGVSTVLAKAGIVFSGFGAIALSVIAAIVAVIMGMVLAWQENFMRMKQITDDFIYSVKKIFEGLFEVIKGLLKFFIAVFKGDFEGAKNAVIQIFKGLASFAESFFLSLMNLVGMVGIGIIRIFWGVVKIIAEAFEWLYIKVKTVLINIWGYAKSIWDRIVSLFSTPITQIISVVTKTVKGKQYGGLVSPRTPYMVGEAGPELFVPRTAGRIVPAGKGASIVFSPVYNINISDKREFESLLKQNNIRMVEDIRRMVET